MSKEVKECWDWLKRFGTEDLKTRFRPVYLYIQQLEKRLADLEKIHDQHMAPQMFKKPLTDKELMVQIQIEKTRKMMSEPFRSTPLKERLQIMIRENKVGTPEWEKTLKWNSLTKEKAMELANEK